MSLRLHDSVHEEQVRIDAARRGDPEAREWLATRFAPVAYRYALRMMRNPEDAHDCAQETLIKLLRNLDRYDARFRFSTWVLRIARNTCIDELRRRRRADREVPDIADPSPGPLELTSRQRRAVRLHRALGELPELYREVLVLYHFEHLKYQEIAELLDIPIGTVMNRIFRARRKLRACYEALGATGLESNDRGDP